MAKQPIVLTDEIAPPPALVRAGFDALPVSRQRRAEQRPRPFRIAPGGALQQHHCMEAANLGLLQAMGKGFGLLHRDSEMRFGGFPLTRRLHGNTRE
jgi:hypothetical protein